MTSVYMRRDYRHEFDLVLSIAAQTIDTLIMAVTTGFEPSGDMLGRLLVNRKTRSTYRSGRDHGISADILDSATLQRLQSIEFSREMRTWPNAFIFAPDSRMLTSFVCGDYSRIQEGLS